MLFHQHGPGKKGIAGIPVTSLHPAHFLYQGWNSYWLRWIAQGKEVYFVVARTKPERPEMVLIGEVLTQVRNQALDIDAAATNCAVQTQASQAKQSCSQGTCAALSRVSKTKIPVETDQESQARIRELEGQFQLLPNLWPQPSRFGGDHLSSPDGPTESNLTFIKCPDLHVLNQGPLTRCL